MGAVLAASAAWEVMSEASSGLGGAMGVVLATSEDWEGQWVWF